MSLNLLLKDGITPANKSYEATKWMGYPDEGQANRIGSF